LNLRETKAAKSIELPTVGEVLVCVFLPFIGVCLGLWTRSQGRRPAGRKMLLISGAMFVVWLGLRLLIQLAHQDQP
jgi:hypothetical protein